MTHKIGIITDSISDQPTGIGRYSFEVMRDLKQSSERFEYVSIDYKRKPFHEANMILIKNNYKLLKSYLWHNSLPTKLRNKNLNFICNFTGIPHLLPYRQN